MEAPPQAPSGGTVLVERPAEEAVGNSSWVTIVWDDPVNLMTYVSYVFRSHFGFSRVRAEELMLQVHHNGKAIVFTGSREEAEKHTHAMHGWGLQATFEKVDN